MIHRKQAWLRVWYESGHGFADGSFSMMRLRDRPFPYSWASFAGFDVTKEKPAPLTIANIGAQDSLFCWVRYYWRPTLNPASPQTGWLACNDGAQEIADFIHLEDAVAGTVTLTLIQVKASKKTDSARQISLGDFEIVVSQAEKNLRFLEMHWLSGEFVQFLSKKLFNAVWHDGTPALRKHMISALKKVTPVGCSGNVGICYLSRQVRPWQRRYLEREPAPFFGLHAITVGYSRIKQIHWSNGRIECVNDAREGRTILERRCQYWQWIVNGSCNFLNHLH